MTNFLFQTSSTYPNDYFHLIKFLISIILMVLKMLQVKMLVFRIFGKFAKFWQILNKIVEMLPSDPSLTFKPVLISFLYFLGNQKFLFQVLEAIRSKMKAWFWHICVSRWRGVKKIRGSDKKINLPRKSFSSLKKHILRCLTYWQLWEYSLLGLKLKIHGD